MQSPRTPSDGEPATPATPTAPSSTSDQAATDGLSDSQAFVLRRLSDDSPLSILRLADDAATEVSEAPADPAAAYYELVSVALPRLVAAGVVEFDDEYRIVELVDRDASGGTSRLSSAANWLAIAGPLVVLVVLGGMIGVTVLAGVTLLSAVLIAAAARHLRRDFGGTADAASVPAAAVTDAVPTDRRILELLLANDGRMRQQSIVEAVDVSAASVSRHLSGLADQDRIDKFPVGRENVVQLAGLRPLSDLDGRPAE